MWQWLVEAFTKRPKPPKPIPTPTPVVPPPTPAPASGINEQFYALGIIIG